jgi:hypothetical protein
MLHPIGLVEETMRAKRGVKCTLFSSLLLVHDVKLHDVDQLLIWSIVFNYLIVFK